VNRAIAWFAENHVAANLLMLLIGWGLVGLASYLLIGFWHKRPEAVAAAKKAFVMNAIGDATFALACVLLIWETGTLEFFGVFEGVDGMSSTTVNLVALGLLGGLALLALGAELLVRGASRIAAAFGSDRLWHLKPTREGNTIAVATHAAAVPDRHILQARADNIEARYGLPARQWLRLLQPWQGHETTSR